MQCWQLGLQCEAQEIILLLVVKKEKVVSGKGIIWFTFLTVEYKLRCSVLRQDSPHFCVSLNYTSVLCVFISSVGFDLVCLRLDF